MMMSFAGPAATEGSGVQEYDPQLTQATISDNNNDNDFAVVYARSATAPELMGTPAAEIRA